MLKYERSAKKRGIQLIIGIDEAGRGPLAGPVVASAVCLKKEKFQQKICDSKKINASQREKAFHEIFENAYVGIGVVSETVIDAINIYQATFFAMTQAVRHLTARLPQPLAALENFDKQVHLLIDGNAFKSDLPYAFTTIIDGENQSLSIAAASIIAKVSRDRILDSYDQVFPQYGFRQHKGYATMQHRAAIKTHGLSLIHRRSFHLAQ